MSRSILCALVAAAVALATGCADVRSGEVANAHERDAAYAFIAQIDAFDQLTYNASDGGALLTAASYEGVVGLLAPDGIPVALLSRTGAPLDGACVSASGGAATFSGCTIAEHTVDGIVSSTRGTVDAEIVDVFVVTEGVHGAATLAAGLGAQDGVVNGDIDVDLMWSTDSADHVMDAHIRIDNVVLDDGGCPTGGSITVNGTVDDRAPTTVALAFGPTCGDVMVER
jgi:hypothetical protein